MASPVTGLLCFVEPRRYRNSHAGPEITKLESTREFDDFVITIPFSFVVHGHKPVAGVTRYVQVPSDFENKIFLIFFVMLPVNFLRSL